MRGGHVSPREYEITTWQGQLVRTIRENIPAAEFMTVNEQRGFMDSAPLNESLLDTADKKWSNKLAKPAHWKCPKCTFELDVFDPSKAQKTMLAHMEVHARIELPFVYSGNRAVSKPPATPPPPETDYYIWPRSIGKVGYRIGLIITDVYTDREGRVMAFFFWLLIAIMLFGIIFAA